MVNNKHIFKKIVNNKQIVNRYSIAQILILYSESHTGQTFFEQCGESVSLLPNKLFISLQDYAFPIRPFCYNGYLYSKCRNLIVVKLH